MGLHWKRGLQGHKPGQLRRNRLKCNEINDDLQRKGPVRTGKNAEQVRPGRSQYIVYCMARCNDAPPARGGSAPSQPADHIAGFLSVKSLPQHCVRTLWTAREG